MVLKGSNTGDMAKVQKNPRNTQKFSSLIMIIISLLFLICLSGKTTAMSRRRVSCRDLSHPDCDGWLWKKRKESSVFIAQKWQRFWFVLNGPHIYWYKSQQVSKKSRKRSSSLLVHLISKAHDLSELVPHAVLTIKIFCIHLIVSMSNFLQLYFRRRRQRGFSIYPAMA